MKSCAANVCQIQDGKSSCSFSAAMAVAPWLCAKPGYVLKRIRYANLSLIYVESSILG